MWNDVYRILDIEVNRTNNMVVVVGNCSALDTGVYCCVGVVSYISGISDLEMTHTSGGSENWRSQLAWETVEQGGAEYSACRLILEN